MTKKSWRVKMNEQRDLRKKGAELLYRRVVLLVECHKDAGFQEYCESEHLNELDYLDAELEDTAATFLTLAAVLKEYPDQDAWAKHNIRELIAMVLETQKPGPVERIRPTWKERGLAAEKECERLRAENEKLRERVGFLEEMLGSKRENATSV